MDRLKVWFGVWVLLGDGLVDSWVSGCFYGLISWLVGYLVAVQNLPSLFVISSLPFFLICRIPMSSPFCRSRGEGLQPVPERGQPEGVAEELPVGAARGGGGTGGGRGGGRVDGLGHQVLPRFTPLLGRVGFPPGVSLLH